jgi:hypothetical protein
MAPNGHYCYQRATISIASAKMDRLNITDTMHCAITTRRIFLAFDLHTRHLNSYAYNEREADEIPIIWKRIIWKLESRVVGPGFLAIEFVRVVASKGHLDKTHEMRSVTSANNFTIVSIECPPILNIVSS